MRSIFPGELSAAQIAYLEWHAARHVHLDTEQALWNAFCAACEREVEEKRAAAAPDHIAE